MRIQSWTCNIEEHQDASSPIFEMFSSRNKISIVELNDDNFLLWRFQVVTALEGYDLEKYLDSSLEPPSQFFNVKVETPQPPLACLLTNYPNSKPRIQEVKTQDQLISSWLLGLMNENILNQMLNCNSTKDIWANLHGIYFARCLAQAMQLKSKLQNIKKRVVPLKEYFMKIQQCVDALASVGKPTPSDDHILYILAGLGPEYESMISDFCLYCSPSIQDITSLLLTKESCIKCTIKAESSLSSANLDAQGLEKDSDQSIK
ncbi:Retrovirus-related Pol polyprotein from transposon TNT 1-94 [Cucumis melo var. makuwa]|uniref:Retrovirus-related Pol polyprotein from transposon TNT 1-94 n=1 Tax=Cucumis melo var. makuwa TaxID=1194695 RepID=A0A5A7VGA1_CUCMM|nr:Retrovirus-related Pol polyprotein from transposon TNT 1-94 [Cucumis melo var. makuwa]TYK15146.1 Retrovirus-related Pol polyprotein from transposon TNT 1-94 [Cucumis melo var. makuwa]